MEEEALRAFEEESRRRAIGQIEAVHQERRHVRRPPAAPPLASASQARLRAEVSCSRSEQIILYGNAPVKFVRAAPAVRSPRVLPPMTSVPVATRAAATPEDGG